MNCLNFKSFYFSLSTIDNYYCSLEVVEHACSIASLMQGETTANIAKDMDTYSYRIPLGVCAGIAP